MAHKKVTKKSSKKNPIQIGEPSKLKQSEKKKNNNNKISVVKDKNVKIIDYFIWLLVFVILAGLVYINQTFQNEINDLFKALISFGTVIVVVIVASLTEKGKHFTKLLKESLTEIIKVDWPTSNDTIKTTSIIILIVALVALFFWLFDFLVSWLVLLLLGI